MEEFDDDTAGDALKLIGDSARTAARRLAFFRLAFGSAGNAEGLTLGEIRGVTAEFMAGGRTQLDWPCGPEAASVQTGEGGLKLLMALIFVALECLPRGGQLKVGLEGASGTRFQVEALGAAARIAASTTAALGGAPANPAGLDAASAPAFYAGAVAKRFGAEIQIGPGPDRVSFALRLS
jgi:histidine phosphotransferase ChpT